MNPKIKIFLSWLLPFIGIVGIFLGLSYFQNNQKEFFPESSPTITPNFPKGTPESGQGNVFKNDKTKQQPESISSQKNQEAMVKALKSGKVEDCKDVADLELKQQCQDSLNYGIFIQRGNPSKCQELHSSALKLKCTDTIVFKKAIESKNRKQCDVIGDEILKNRCLDELNFTLAKNSLNANDCNMILNANEKTLCQDEIKMKEAIKQNQADLCDSITNNTLKDQCLSIIKNNQIQAAKAQQMNEAKQELDVRVDELESCKLMTGENKQNCQDEAYFQAAFQEKNLLYCKQIQNEEKKAKCNIQQQAAIDQYYYKKALQNKAADECYFIQNKEVQSICLKALN